LCRKIELRSTSTTGVESHKYTGERERSMRVKIRIGAEGATAPETLRQTNRSTTFNLWKAERTLPPTV
jgi:hypothetical protein